MAFFVVSGIGNGLFTLFMNVFAHQLGLLACSLARSNMHTYYMIRIKLSDMI